jgi:phosphomannomutase
MTLIKSISGFRGTIGGKAGENLTPVDIVESTAAYGEWLKESTPLPLVIIGRDGRSTGLILTDLVRATLISQGINVIDIGLTTTPTLEMYIPFKEADGGIIFSASHNPMDWNALKLFNEKGEFISAEDGKRIIEISENRAFFFSKYQSIGTIEKADDAMAHHIQKILEHPWVLKKEIEKRKFRIVVDCINSTGSLSILPLLRKLNCDVIPIFDQITGEFEHDPEPLEKNLDVLLNTVKTESADLGIAVDPDVDRIAFITEEGMMFGEEYTIVAIADYLFDNKLIEKSVSNLSSSRALNDISQKHGGSYQASAVGEVNVVNKMKESGAIYGGEGNGGVIVGDLHYGRDAVMGAALFLSGLAHFDITASEWKSRLPEYHMSKMKVALTPAMNADKILTSLENKYKDEKLYLQDGLKIDFPDFWVHIRKSNTEPIIRIYTEATTLEKAKEVARSFKSQIQDLY